jgi:hypothetical protein
VLSADQVLAELARLMGCERALFARRAKGTAHRPFAARYLTRYAGLSQREVAAILGVSTGAAISLQLRRFEALVADNRKLRSLAKKCDKALSALMTTVRKAQN